MINKASEGIVIDSNVDQSGFADERSRSKPKVTKRTPTVQTQCVNNHQWFLSSRTVVTAVVVVKRELI